MAETDVYVDDLKGQSLEGADLEHKQEQEVDLDALIQQRIEAETLKYKKEIQGLNRKNTSLTHELNGKKTEKQSVEERLRELESERARERLHTAELEAFADSKIDVDWLKPFHTDDPYERATLMKGLLEEHERKIAENMSRQLGTRYPLKSRKVPDKENFTTEELRGLSPDEINKLWDAGKIAGSR